MDAIKITVELSLKEAYVLCNAIQGYSPPKEDEMISIMLYARITKKIDETSNK